MYMVIKFKETMIKSKLKWIDIFPFLNDDKFKDIHKSIYHITDPKFKWFQFRINHFILTTNKLAYKMKLIDSPLCTFCKSETESLIHLLWSCNVVQDFIKNINDFLRQFTIIITIDKFSFLLGPYNGIDPVNEIILLSLKHFIYKCKCLKQNLSVRHFISQLSFVYKIQKELYSKRNQLDEFSELWSSWSIVFGENQRLNL